MKIGIVSDSHDNRPLIRKAVHYFNEVNQVEAVIHAGDFVAPFSVKDFAALQAPFYGVFGNNDGETDGIRKAMPQIVQPPLHLELGGKHFVVVHDLNDLKTEDRSKADVIICGHTHNPEVKQNDVLLVNPGELAGWLTGVSTVAVLDLDTMNVEIIRLNEE